MEQTPGDLSIVHIVVVPIFLVLAGFQGGSMRNVLT